MTRYETHVARGDALASEAQLFARYRAARGARPTDSLDTYRGRTLPIGQAVTVRVGRVRSVAGTWLLEVPDAMADRDDGRLVERSALPQPIQDALDAEDDPLPARAQARRPR